MPIIVALTLTACKPGEEPVQQGAITPPEYGAISTRLLEDELVSINVQLKNAVSEDVVIRYNDCAAAQYALIRGAAFVRRVTNEVTKRGGTWRGEGVYTLSDTNPGGDFPLDAGVTVAACRSDNIPLV